MLIGNGPCLVVSGDFIVLNQRIIFEIHRKKCTSMIAKNPRKAFQIAITVCYSANIDRAVIVLVNVNSLQNYRNTVIDPKASSLGASLCI
jgi:GTP:adenosylcobinamide-phosphate guanylyltransferase